MRLVDGLWEWPSEAEGPSPEISKRLEKPVETYLPPPSHGQADPTSVQISESDGTRELGLAGEPTGAELGRLEVNLGLRRQSAK